MKESIAERSSLRRGILPPLWLVSKARQLSQSTKPTNNSNLTEGSIVLAASQCQTYHCLRGDLQDQTRVTRTLHCVRILPSTGSDGIPLILVISEWQWNLLGTKWSLHILPPGEWMWPCELLEWMVHEWVFCPEGFESVLAQAMHIHLLMMLFFDGWD